MGCKKLDIYFLPIYNAALSKTEGMSMTSGWVSGAFPFQAGAVAIRCRPNLIAMLRSGWCGSRGSGRAVGEGGRGLRSPQGTLLEGLWPIGPSVQVKGVTGSFPPI